MNVVMLELPLFLSRCVLSRLNKKAGNFYFSRFLLQDATKLFTFNNRCDIINVQVGPI